MRLTSPFLPYFKRTKSQLSTSESIFYHVSADMEDTWANNIFHNSRYGIFHLSNGKLELISKGINTTKFRKCKCESEEVAMTKILTWYQKTIEL